MKSKFYSHNAPIVIIMGNVFIAEKESKMEDNIIELKKLAPEASEVPED
jgi:hypothetical protein